MSNTVIRLANIPWQITQHDLRRYFINELNVRVRNPKILYNKATGLSRGFGFVDTTENDAKELLRRGSVQIDGREVIMTKYVDRRQGRSDDILDQSNLNQTSQNSS